MAPLDAPVEAEIDVSSADIGFIAVGDPVQLKLDAYSYVLYGIARGVVTHQRRLILGRCQQHAVPPYFKVRVKVTNLELHDVPPRFRLIPGMTLVGDIMVGRRTIMSYLTETLLRQGAEAMREPQ